MQQVVGSLVRIQFPLQWLFGIGFVHEGEFKEASAVDDEVEVNGTFDWIVE